MNDQSPPKRVTRARAAAKTETGAGIKTTKVTTAASKAKLTRATSTTKRRTRAGDDQEQEDELQESQHEEIIEPQPKATRGRPKRTTQSEPVQEEAPAPVRATRGRPKKIIAEAPAPVAEPVRSTRGRKKIEVEEEAVVVEESVKRPTRARAVPASKAALPKKSVKFEEPDKENIMPTGAKDNKIKVAETATGLRAKPVRKPAVARTTREISKSGDEETTQKVAILSPKKATQVAVAKDSISDDELATTEKTPMRPLQKSPIKPTGNIFGSVRKPDLTTSISVNRASVPAQQDMKNSIMSSPARRPPPSPFKESLNTSPQRAPLGSSMLQSPFKLSLGPPKATTTSSSFKASLLTSPARRPQSPMKISEAGSPSRSPNKAPLFAVTPKASTFKISRFATPRTLTKSVSRPGMMLPPSLPTNSVTQDLMEVEESTSMDTEPSMSFSGRLSSIVPREVDNVYENVESTDEHKTELEFAVKRDQEQPPALIEQLDAIMDHEMNTEDTISSAPKEEENQRFAPVSFEFRETEGNSFEDSDSEDELASDLADYSPIPLTGFQSLSRGSSPATPGPSTSAAKTPKTVTQKLSIQSKNSIGFTPLAKQLGDWMAASPVKSSQKMSNASALSFEDQLQADSAPIVTSPMKTTYFEDEMTVRDELADAPEPISMEADLMENFELVEVEEEDLDLAQEADEMSLLEPAEVEALLYEDFQAEEDLQIEEVIRAAAELQAENMLQTAMENEQEVPETEEVEEVASDQSFEENVAQTEDDKEMNSDECPDEIMQNYEPALSEASQEYGDENATLIDPALLSLPAPPQQAARINLNFATPKRVLTERTFHTISKVPLKAAAEDSSMRLSPKKRSASISRLPAQRPTNALSRNNTVISYSPMKSTSRVRSTQNLDVPMQDVICTPSKGDVADWSTMGTPARTPRRDLNAALLKGVVAFVDVHTSEGADASVLFTELLTQMGARCVKTWTWNGCAEDNSKIGITHVVFKDGGKRTLERCREANGVVSCVGVGWVLDCERENKWLDEQPYSVDTAMVPRGGHKRRKSMEPRALANMNGTLVSTSLTPGRKSFANMSSLKGLPDTPVTNKSRRRESVQWVHSPAVSSPDENDQTLMLSPVPATPAPEVISAYGEDGLYGDETPTGQTPYFMHNDQLVQQTAPVHKYIEDEQNMGAGFLSQKKNESVMMRLMAARRKSLQWAPKVGSPLARGSLF